MTSHEIRPKQLRALLLLLVLVPLIPTVLMIRFVLDAVESERAAALERTASVYQKTLLKADASFARQIAERKQPPTAAEVQAHYRALFDAQVIVRVVDDSEKVLAGPAAPGVTRIAQSPLREAGLPWTVEVWLGDHAAINTAVKEQVKAYARTVVVAVIAIFTIAVAAALTVSRQLALHELKTTSVATVAHELRTPLASMRMLIDTLREGRYRSEEQMREYLDLVASENVRLSRLTDNFLTLSRLERKQHAFDLKPVAPREIIDQTMQAMRTRLEAPGVHFRCEVREPLAEIRADREALVAVFTNLLDNALKYTEADKQIALNVRGDDATVVFSVADNGVGLSRAERRAIFQPFHQADQKLSRAREGCGLGLAIVKHIVRAHRGQILVKSDPGKGSTFTVMIPAAAQRG